MRIELKQLARQVRCFALVAVLCGAPGALCAQDVVRDTTRLVQPQRDSVPRSMQPAALSRRIAPARADDDQQPQGSAGRPLDKRVLVITIVIAIVVAFAAAHHIP